MKNRAEIVVNKRKLCTHQLVEDNSPQDATVRMKKQVSSQPKMVTMIILSPPEELTDSNIIL